MPGRNFLFVPGPSNTPDRIQRAMHRATDDHRSPSFPDLPRAIFPKLKQVLGTESGQAFVFASTGTGMWEAALVNTLSPGDRLLAVRGGQFAHLFIDSARRLGFQVDVIETEWGEAAPADRIEEALRADAAHEIKGVLVVHNETSTGVTSDIAAVRRAIDSAGHPALFYVDGVSSVASIEFRMDDWGVDLAITGSQKGFMLPAGLGMVGVSQKALALRESARCPRAFFDFGPMIKSNAEGYFPYTPAVTLLHGLREALDILLEEGLENVYARHRRLADACRAAVKAWGLELCARDPRSYSNTVSSVMVPASVDSNRVIERAYHRYNLSLGAGLGQLGGKLFRIGHLGDLNELMLLGALSGVEMAMKDVGMDVKLGSGVAAAQGMLV
jgi:alanine-glyoxylate transaminase/serine-glyoxylate transaminase/serine-pyruvate transaminase